MRLYKKLSVLLVPAILTVSGNINAAQGVSEADSLYLSGNYTGAIEKYNEVSEEYGVSAPLLYNLGNAYLQAGDYGNAMVSYERAKKLDPSNKRINTNLTYLRGKVEDANKAEQKGKRKKVTEDTPNFFQTIQSSVSQNTASNTWAAWAAGSFLLFAGCVCLYLFSSNVLMRKTGFFGGFILLGFSMIFLVCAYSSAAESENREYGVITGYKVPLMTEPGSSQSEENSEGVLTRGTKVRIISEETDAEGKVTWYKVRLNTDYIGWVTPAELTVI